MQPLIRRCVRVLSAIVTLSFLILGFTLKSAMAQENAASLNGLIKDSSGALVPNAGIKLTALDTGVVQVKESNADGLYSFVNVPPGRYSLEVRVQGFETGVQPGFSLEVNQTATINFTMKVGSANDVVNVSAQAVALETSTAELGPVVKPKKVNHPPLSGSNSPGLLLLPPGVSAANPLQNSGGA